MNVFAIVAGVAMAFVGAKLVSNRIRFSPNQFMALAFIAFAVTVLLSPLNPLAPTAASINAAPAFNEQLMRRAIGHAEGNLTVSGELTSLYYGHTDPGNRVRNFGYCSNQNRTASATGADESCDRYILQFKPRAIAELQNAGISLQDTEAIINTLDLANQANPRSFPRFPHQLARARKQGLKGIEAITKARVESFGTGGHEATGLINICKRENRPVTDTECVAYDQRRRANAIRKVIEQWN